MNIRGLNYNLRTWGPENAPLVIALHGWLDCGALFQPLVSQLRRDWHIVAPDWRGCGLTDRDPAAAHAGYRFLEYVADLDALVRALAPQGEVRIIGHSLGANVASQFAGIRPNAVSHLVCIDAAEGTDAGAQNPATRLARWLDSATSQPRFPTYTDEDAVVQFLMKTNHHWTEETARFVAFHNYRVEPYGQHTVRADPANGIREPLRYRESETDAIWSAVRAGVLAIDAIDQHHPNPFVANADEFLARRSHHFKRFHHIVVEDAGHHIHLEQPLLVATAIEDFFSRD